ncbi:Carboxylesterase [Trichodelitschia bisporula]|uniref:Carboxylic ester hydrolase n=1 Tax=Trichodelitschia bisporula TaxID=703511 RepID=A0A6G1HLI3_9PEZI|nr:Carboxylesterase [Trichodelitschia bisporula]
MHHTAPLLAALLVASVSAQLPGLPRRGSPTVSLDSGSIAGTTTTVPKGSATVDVEKYLGVPFAAPPERFRAPKEPRRWRGTRDAKAYKPACIQQFVSGPNREFTMSVFNNPAPPESEDCLYLNVYAPANRMRNGRGRAVLFWIYGGGLQFGSASMPGYDGSYLAANQDVVVVTANYRTNLFGFPASPQMKPTDRNLGFLDQRLALDWVQRNIDGFGGDPRKVTLFGESAGAVSIDALLTSYNATSRPPFHAAILQSGQISVKRRNTNPAQAFENWALLSAAVGCMGNRTLTCMERVSAGKLKMVGETNNLNFNPVTDGVTLVNNPASRRIAGQIPRIPVLIGSNAGEGRVFVKGATNITQYIAQTFPGQPERSKAVAKEYAVGKDGLKTPYDSIAQIMTDVQFGCPVGRFVSDSLAGRYPVWRYYYNATFPNLEKFPNAGAFHSAEIDLIFGTYGKRLAGPESALPSTPQENALSAYIQKSWANFAKNPLDGPGWLAAGTASADVLEFGSAEAKLIRASDIDSRCWLYNSLY